LRKVKLEVAIPGELVDRIDTLLRILGFNDREEFVVSAVRRLVDLYFPVVRNHIDSC